MIRTQAGTLAKILFSSIHWLLGTEIWNQSEEFVEKEGGSKNAEFAREIFPYARTMMQVWFIGRILLFIVSFKWPRLIKYQIYYELITDWFSACMPVKINADREIQYYLLIITQTTILSYFELVPTLIATALTLVPIHVSRVIFYDDSP